MNRDCVKILQKPGVGIAISLVRYSPSSATTRANILSAGENEDIFIGHDCLHDTIVHILYFYTSCLRYRVQETGHTNATAVFLLIYSGTLDSRLDTGRCVASSTT